METTECKVRIDTDPKGLGGLISRKLIEGNKILVKSIGLASLNNAVKGIIFAKSYVSSSCNKEMRINPFFETKDVSSEGRSDEVTILVFELLLAEKN